MSESQLQDQATYSVTVDGRELPFIFNKRDGGKATSEGSKTPPGGGRAEKAHGGRQTVEDLSLSFEFVWDRDNDTLQWLKGRRGKGNASVVENLIDTDGNVFGRGNSWTGKLSAVDTGTYDAKSSEVREGMIDVETDGTVG